MRLWLLGLARAFASLFSADLTVDGVSTFEPGARVDVTFGTNQDAEFFCTLTDRALTDGDQTAALIVRHNFLASGYLSADTNISQQLFLNGTTFRPYASCLLEGNWSFNIQSQLILGSTVSDENHNCGSFTFWSEANQSCVNRIAYVLRLHDNCDTYERMPDEWIQLAAVTQLAVMHVNQRDYSLVSSSGEGALTKVFLDDNWGDVMYDDLSCGAGGVSALKDAMEVGVSGLLGPGRSASSTTTAIVADALYSVPVISWWATSVKLSSKTDYPMFGRVIAPDSLSADAIVALCKYYGWSTVAAAGVDDDYGSPFMSDFLQKAALAGIRVISTFKWENGNAAEVQTAFNGLADSGARVFLALIFAIDMPAAWEVIQNRSLHGPGYMWISTDIIQLEAKLTDTMGGWLDGMIRCTARTYAEPGWGNLQLEFKNMDLAPFNNSFLSYNINLTNKPLNDLAPMLYDGVWLYAYALEKLMLQPNNTIDFSLSPGERLLAALKSVNFTGVSGKVSLDANGDRLYMGVSIQNFDLRNLSSGFVEKGTWVQSEGIKMLAPIHWPGGMIQVPRDAASEIRQLVAVAEWAFALVVVLCVLGTLVAVFVIVMHMLYRREPVIKSSTPLFNIISVLGTLVVYAHLILWGSTDVPTSEACEAMIWLLAVGFTLCFGPLFVKTHRIHAIFNVKKLRHKLRLTDNKLLGTVIVLLLIDIIICTVMSAVDGPVPVVVRFGSGVPSDPAPVPEFLTYQYYVTCRAKDETITTLLIVYKFAILAYGSYLAYRVRKIGLLQFNDSSHLAMSIYNTTLTACLAIGLSTLDSFKETATARYLVLSLLIYYLVTASMAIVHIPKLWAILNGTVDKWARTRTGTGNSAEKGSRSEGSVDSDGTYVQALQRQIRALGLEPVQPPTELRSSMRGVSLSNIAT